MEEQNTTEQKHPGGRPTSYSEEMLQKTKEYIEACNEEHEVRYKPKLVEDKVVEEPYIHYNPKIPTIEGLAYELKVNKTTIYEWENKHEEFSNVIDELRNKQASQLVNKGLSGQYNSTIAKVLLTKHGYREGADLTTNDRDLPTPILGGILNAISDNDSNKESSTPQ